MKIRPCGQMDRLDEANIRH